MVGDAGPGAESVPTVPGRDYVCRDEIPRGAASRLKGVARERPREGVLHELIAELGTDRVERGAPLAPLTTFRVGGPADALYRARTADELVRAVSVAKRLGIPCFLLGKGANILVGDRGFRGLVVRCEVGDVEFLEGGRVRAGAGVETFPDLIDATVARGLGGLHHFVGIPSTPPNGLLRTP